MQAEAGKEPEGPRGGGVNGGRLQRRPHNRQIHIETVKYL